MRITTGMVQRSTLADLNRVSERRHPGPDARRARNREIQRPSDDPYNAARALKLRGSLAGVAAVPAQHRGRAGLAGGHRARAVGDHRRRAARPRARSCRAPRTPPTPSPRESIAKEIDQLIEASSRARNATYQRPLHLRRHRRPTRRRTRDGADDAYNGDRPAIARQIGPGVSLAIGTPASVPRRRPGAADGKLLDMLRDIAAHLRGGDARRAAHDRPRADRRQPGRPARRARRSTAPAPNRLEAAPAAWPRSRRPRSSSCPRPRTPTSRRRSSSFNSQQAAYQAALKAGASIVQTSLMDFLR